MILALAEELLRTKPLDIDLMPRRNQEAEAHLTLKSKKRERCCEKR
jgi:hypothetical protein